MFKWNKNDFSRPFKCTSGATEYVKKFQTLDRVQQIVLTKAVGDREDLHSETSPASENQQENEPEIPGEDNQPPPKKQKKTHLKWGKLLMPK